MSHSETLPNKKITKQNQKERFIETAKKIEADESGALFENAFSKIIPPKKAAPSKNDI